jgi:hypothetical protein
MTTQKLTVPNKLSEITLGQYQKFNKIVSKDPDIDFLRKKTIEIFCGVELAKVDQYKYTSIVEVTEIINKMFEKKPKLIQRFEKQGIEYGFIPVLTDMTFGEFVDLDTLMSDWDTMHEAMGVLFRKVKQKHKEQYLIEEYDSDKRADMTDMPLDVALGAIFFLQSLRKESLKHLESYLQNQVKELSPAMKKRFMTTSDGGQPSITSQKVI